MKLRTLYILLFCLFLTGKAYSQKVALVLSGGGAKGIAHVGVIKALEENQIPIDYVIGTSMGGIVGGLYSAGFSPEEMEEIILSGQMESWVLGEINPLEEYYFAKGDPTPTIFSVDVGVDSGLNVDFFPSLASDRGINFAFAELMAQASQKANYDFDQLFVPFRATGSEIFSENTVTMKKGNLNDAVRITMSIPLIYNPIKFEGQYLFDGGIYDNFPVDIARRDFSPDIIIGVNVSDKVFNEYPADKADKMVGQAIIYALLGKSDSTQIGEKDIYLEPDVLSLSATAFGKGMEIMEAGYKEAYAKMEQIKAKIALRRPVEEVASRRQAFRASQVPLLFGELQLSGFSPRQEKYVRQFFQGMQQTPMTVSEIQDRYHRLTLENFFTQVYPAIIYNPSRGNFDFEIQARTKDLFKFELGGLVSTRSISMVHFGAQYNHLQRFLNTYKLGFTSGNFYKSFSFQSRHSLPNLYFQPSITLNYWDFLDSEDLIIKEQTSTYLSQADRRLGLTIGIPVKLKGRFEGEAFYILNSDNYSPERLDQNESLDKIDFEGIKTRISFSQNSLNQKSFPWEGTAFSIFGDYVSGTENYTPGKGPEMGTRIQSKRSWFRAKSQYQHYFQAGKRVSLGILAEGVISTQPLFETTMGSQLYASAFFPNHDSKTWFLQKFRAFNYAASGAQLVFHIVPKTLDLRLEGSAFKPFGEIRDNTSGEPELYFDHGNVYFAGSANLVYHSAIGPISLSYNYAADDEQLFNILFYAGFLIFNKRSLE